MKTWRKNLIALSVLLAVCAGIYVNWCFTEQDVAVSLTDTLDESKILSQDLLVMSNEGYITSNMSNTSSEYFAAVRLSRQEARDSALGLLQEAMAYEGNTDADQTSAQLEQIVQVALCESQIESLVIAKGYDDCVTYISDKGVSVAVASPEGGLLQSDVAVIADIVMTQSDYTMEDIYVVEVQ